MSKSCDVIQIRLPQKADYMSFIRLSVSGIASKMGFDIDTIEDIKVAVSEVCNRIISLCCGTGEADYEISFHLFDSDFRAVFRTDCQPDVDLFEGESGEFARAIISTLMDEFDITYDQGCVITMGKKLGDCMNG